MHYPHPDSEQALENATIKLFSELGWNTANCYDEELGTNGSLGRLTRDEVVLLFKLRTALARLNLDLPEEAF